MEFSTDTGIERVAAEWRAALRCTEPADRTAAERGLHALYRASGWHPPRRVLWFDSPGAAVAAVVALREPALFSPGVEHFDATAVRDEFTPDAWRRLRQRFSRSSRDHIKRMVDEVLYGLAEARTPALERAGCGQHDALWIGLFDAGRRVFGIEQSRGLDGWASLARSCGRWWAFRTTAIVCERQRTLHLDERERLHALDGPALGYADGFAVYAICGVRVDPWMVNEPARVTADVITAQPNSEVRRVLMDRYGVERYLDDSHAVAVACDDFGTLYRLESPDEREPLVLVKVRNATPEPDGSIKDYFLRVPPAMRTPHEAVAWTFALHPSGYRPQIET